jgi:hypothetical protein
VVIFEGIKKFEVIGLPLELNSLKCANLSATGFLANNDINRRASCFDVNFSMDSVLTIRASSGFGYFMFQNAENRVVQTVDTFDFACYEGMTCIRLAFNEFEIKHFGFGMDEIDPTQGVFVPLQKEK